MTKVVRIAWRRWGVVLALFVLGTGVYATQVGIAHAQEGLSVTVTPPLFQLTIGPGERWASSLKVVNNNSYDVTYYVRVVDMEASGEEGRSKFTPLVNLPEEAEYERSTLARWIEIASSTFRVSRGQSGDIPFFVTIPSDASPGGHYAAILVGTEPDGPSMSGSHMKVSSFVSSLIFVRIKGDVVENGRVREFRTQKSLYESPMADFVLRFENIGNTHLKPEGEITIYNMWGKERGRTLINQDTSFGNVLPNSVRKFQFSWEGDQNVFDVGRYSAVVTLTYGEEGKQNVTATTYFWVIPIVPVAIGLSTFVVFIVLLIWLIRRYVKRALMLEKMRLGIAANSSYVRQPVIETIIEPIREGVIDLRRVSSTPPGAQEVPLAQKPSDAAPTYQRSLTPGQFFLKYKLFFLFLLVVGLSVAGIVRYFDKVLVAERGFEIRDVKIEVETPPGS